MSSSNHKHKHERQHNHGHAGHSHGHASGNIAVAFFLNTGFALIELVGGLLTNSVAIMSDALHDLGDSLSLGTAWYFQRQSKKERSDNFTYGYKRFSLVGAFINAIVLIIGSVFIISEAVQRLFNPEQVNAKGMVVLAIIGILVNGAAMLRLKKGQTINERIVSLHFLEDVLGWFAVLLGAVVMMFVNLPVIDPVLSLLIASFVLFNVYRNIKPAFKIILQGVPDDVTEKQVREMILSEKEVLDLHDFHIWTLDGQHHIMSMHIVVDHNMSLKEAQLLKEKIKARLAELDITHATIEVEFDPENCQQLSYT
jgi:cobalt-zinc-cadmium efflux system protein